MNSIYVLPEKFLDTNNFKNNQTGLSFGLKFKIIFQILKIIIKKWIFFHTNVWSQDNAYFALKFGSFYIVIF